MWEESPVDLLCLDRVHRLRGFWGDVDKAPKVNPLVRLV